MFFKKNQFITRNWYLMFHPKNYFIFLLQKVCEAEACSKYVIS